MKDNSFVVPFALKQVNYLAIISKVRNAQFSTSLTWLKEYKIQDNLSCQQKKIKNHFGWFSQIVFL